MSSADQCIWLRAIKLSKVASGLSGIEQRNVVDATIFQIAANSNGQLESVYWLHVAEWVEASQSPSSAFY